MSLYTKIEMLLLKWKLLNSDSNSDTSSRSFLFYTNGARLFPLKMSIISTSTSTSIWCILDDKAAFKFLGLVVLCLFSKWSYLTLMVDGLLF